MENDDDEMEKVLTVTRFLRNVLNDNNDAGFIESFDKVKDIIGTFDEKIAENVDKVLPGIVKGLSNIFGSLKVTSLGGSIPLLILQSVDYLAKFNDNDQIG